MIVVIHENEEFEDVEEVEEMEEVLEERYAKTKRHNNS